MQYPGIEIGVGGDDRNDSDDFFDHHWLGYSKSVHRHDRHFSGADQFRTSCADEPLAAFAVVLGNLCVDGMLCGYIAIDLPADTGFSAVDSPAWLQ